MSIEKRLLVEAEYKEYFSDEDFMNPYKVHGTSYILKKEDVEDVVTLYDLKVFLIDGLEPSKENLEALNKGLLDTDIDYDEEAIKNYILSIFPSAEIEIKVAGEVEPAREQLVFSSNLGSPEFDNLTSWDTTKLYQYWDGHNLEKIRVETTTEIEYEEDTKKCLDEWNGCNWQCGGTGLHQAFYTLISVDGEKQEDMYLLILSSDWQEDIDKAIILTKSELKEHLDEIKSDAKID